MFSLLDLQSIIIPVKGLKIGSVKDAKTTDYKPRGNPFNVNDWRI